MSKFQISPPRCSLSLLRTLRPVCLDFVKVFFTRSFNRPLLFLVKVSLRSQSSSSTCIICIVCTACTSNLFLVLCVIRETPPEHEREQPYTTQTPKKVVHDVLCVSMRLCVPRVVCVDGWWLFLQRFSTIYIIYYLLQLTVFTYNTRNNRVRLFVRLRK